MEKGKTDCFLYYSLYPTGHRKDKDIRLQADENFDPLYSAIVNMQFTLQK